MTEYDGPVRARRDAGLVCSGGADEGGVEREREREQGQKAGEEHDGGMQLIEVGRWLMLCRCE